MWSDERWKVARRCGAKHISEVKMYKAHQVPHFWKLRCRKSARRCGAKHISKSKVLQKLTVIGTLLEVDMSKKCTPLWRRSTFRSQKCKKLTGTEHFWKFDMSFRAAGARDCAPCQQWVKTWGFCSSFNYNHHCHYTGTTTILQLQLHYTTLHYALHVPLSYNLHHTTTTLHSTPLRYTPLHNTTTLQLHYTTLQLITLQLQLHTKYTTLHLRYTTLITLHYANYITLQLQLLHYTALHYTTLHYHYTTPLQLQLQLQLQLHYTTTTLRYTYTTPHYTTLHYTTLHYSYKATTTATLHYTTLHYTTLHYPTLHYTTLITPPQMQLQLHYTTNYTTPQLQLHYTTTTTTAALHHTTSSSCGWGDRPGDHCNHCNHSKKHNSNHLSVHQWIRRAIRDSQQSLL